MADHHPQHIPERLLQQALNRQVQEKLGIIFRDASALTRDMSPEDSKAAKEMILDMIHLATQDVYSRMLQRLERNESPNTDNGRRMESKGQ